MATRINYDAELSRTNGGSRPVPDPTLLTTQQLIREIASLKELIFTRFDSMDKANGLLQTTIDHIHDSTEKSIKDLKELYEEKFASIQVQFKERDTRTEQTSRDSKVAVDAALQAAKEAVSEQNKSNALSTSKSEAATTKLIDQLQFNMSAQAKASDEKINDVKERLTTIEGRTAGSAGTTGMYIAVGALVIAGVVAFSTLSHSGGGTPPVVYVTTAPATTAPATTAPATTAPATTAPATTAPATTAPTGK